jgi:sulfofructose kinase
VPSRSWDVISVGANSVDRVVILPAGLETVVPSGKMPMLDRQLLCGGQSATLACACAMFGFRTAYVGVVGDDPEGRFVRDTLAAHGVDVGNVHEHRTVTRGSVILVNDETGDRIVLSDRNEQLRFRPQEIALGSLMPARCVHVDDVDEDAAIAAATAARDFEVPVTSDIDQVRKRTETLISLVTYPIFDDQIPCALTGAGDVEGALRKLRRLNPGVLCATMGEEGAAALEGDRFYHVPAFKVFAVDTTGAGDTFRAGFIFGLLQGWPVPELLRFANAAAALSCTKRGAIASIPTLADVKRTLAGVSTTEDAEKEQRS